MPDASANALPDYDLAGPISSGAGELRHRTFGFFDLTGNTTANVLLGLTVHEKRLSLVRLPTRVWSSNNDL
jgi:hypothetical protein